MRFYLFPLVFIKSLTELLLLSTETVFGIAPAVFYEKCFVFPGQSMILSHAKKSKLTKF